jgi:hypothetical protein
MQPHRLKDIRIMYAEALPKQYRGGPGMEQGGIFLFQPGNTFPIHPGKPGQFLIGKGFAHIMGNTCQIARMAVKAETETEIVGKQGAVSGMEEAGGAHHGSYRVFYADDCLPHGGQS